MIHRASVHDGRAWRQGLAFWLLLLSIFMHALVPAGSPLHGSPGSAFSATTAEVAIAPERKALAAEEALSGAGGPGSSDGPAAADDPAPPPFGAGVPADWPPEPAKISRPAVSTRASDGGAAPFSARAPPSI